jgi:mannose-6-phosphate isomerase-like protein (cupin superfamily)
MTARAAGAVVRAADVRTDRTETGVSMKVLLDTGSDGPGLVRRMVEVPPGRQFTGTAGAAGELWFVVSGAAGLELDGEPGPALSPDRGLWIPPGATYQVQADDGDELRLDIVTLPAATSDTGSDPDPAADPRTPRSSDLADCAVETTGDRKFRVLFGPGRGCSVATQFVGEIPPGRAPEHSHPYDEVVLIMAGDGVAHIGGTEHELAPGTCLHLPPGFLHCLENTGTQMLRVLGVFHPADSPAAKLQSHG